MGERVALVVTFLNEIETIGRLLEGIESQTRRPDEIVLVDGGSKDGTRLVAEAWALDHPSARVIKALGAGIGRGRNLGISSTQAPIIAVTDAGCRAEAGWLEALVSPIEGGRAEVSMGFYRPRALSALARLASCINIPDADEVRSERFLPSARSVAYRRDVWEAVGGYPEWLDIGEDMYFNLRVLEGGYRREFVPGAVVEWDLRGDVAGFLRQYFRYARGDGIAGMHPRRHAVRFSAYAGAGGAAGLAVWAAKPLLLAVPAALGVAWLLPAYRRAMRRLRPSERALAIFAIPLLTAAMDGAKMAGYIAGRKHSSSRRREVR